MVGAGVIDADAFESIYAGQGGLDEASKQLLYGVENDVVRISRENAAVLLNLFWAFGFSNKNEILEVGPMTDPQYGGADRFASTGGWSLAQGNAMEHYSAHAFVTLTPLQQVRVARVAQNIYRPCCGNSTYFPDCNHGMAMLGLLELMAAEDANEEEMYNIALYVNAYWFPDVYLTLATYFAERGVSWDQVDAKEMLGYSYSSSAGYSQVLSEITPVQSQGGGGCSV